MFTYESEHPVILLINAVEPTAGYVTGKHKNSNMLDLWPGCPGASWTEHRRPFKRVNNWT